MYKCTTAKEFSFVAVHLFPSWLVFGRYQLYIRYCLRCSAQPAHKLVLTCLTKYRQQALRAYCHTIYCASTYYWATAELQVGNEVKHFMKSRLNFDKVFTNFLSLTFLAKIESVVKYFTK